MYLEISARRSGKTTRLHAEVRRQSKLGNPCIIIYPNMNMLAQNRACVNWIPNVKAITIGKYLSAYIHEAQIEWKTGLVLSPNTKKFFEEFDMYTSVHRVPVDKNAYYVTTPRFTRDSRLITSWKENRRSDLLLSLLQQNMGQYTAHTWGDVLSGTEYEHLSKEAFASEFGHQLFGLAENRRKEDRRK